MCLLWAVGAVRLGGAGGHAGAAIEHYFSLRGEEGMWAVGAVGVVGALLWAVSAVKAQNQTFLTPTQGGSADSILYYTMLHSNIFYFSHYFVLCHIISFSILFYSILFYSMI